jgi:hypothetical protein
MPEDPPSAPTARVVNAFKLKVGVTIDDESARMWRVGEVKGSRSRKPESLIIGEVFKQNLPSFHVQHKLVVSEQVWLQAGSARGVEFDANHSALPIALGIRELRDIWLVSELFDAGLCNAILGNEGEEGGRFTRRRERL